MTIVFLSSTYQAENRWYQNTLTSSARLTIMRTHALAFLSLFSAPIKCQSKETTSSFLVCFSYSFWSVISFASGQVIVGGQNDLSLSSVEIFPPPPSNTCSIPDLPEGRIKHSLSLLSGGRLVVCGGGSISNTATTSCIVWTAESNRWTDFHSTRSCHYILHANQTLTQQHWETVSCCLDTPISPRLHHTSWWLGS